MRENEQQHKAIVLNKGPALILAGPGSGKTYTIVERIRYLIQNCHVDPSSILVITFTKAAARQMRDRFFTRMGDGFYPVTFGTFHAIFFQILKTSCHYAPDCILNDKEKREYLRTVLNSMPGTFPMEEEWEEQLLSEIGYLKNRGSVPEGFQSACLERKLFQQVFVAFQKLLMEQRRLDLDDFAAAVRQLFLRNPGLLSEWQKRFPYILVDEFQDVNALQYEVVKLLAGQHANLFAVGDDDQAIYGFRGSDPGVMQQFLQDFPKAEQILLSVNYRSRPGIVEMAGKLIACNRERFVKQITPGREKEEKTEQLPGDTGRKLTPDGTVTAAGFSDRRTQTEWVAARIKECLCPGPAEEGAAFGGTALADPPQRAFSVAAIFRTNTDAGLLAEQLAREKIPFVMREKIKNPYHHPVCRDLLSYLQFAMVSPSRTAFFRIMNRPCRYLARQKLPSLQVDFQALCRAYQDKPYMQQLILKLQRDISRIAGMDLYAAVHYVRKGIGYEDWMRKEWQGDKLQEGLQMAAFFQDSVRNFATVEQLEAHISRYEQLLKQAGKQQTQENGAVLLTMHGAKGLEYDVVFLPDCNEGIVPHKKSRTGKELEEERRMFYVGMTRARERLCLTWVTGTKEEPGFASRFLHEMGIKNAAGG